MPRLLWHYGNHRVPEVIELPAEDHTSELAEVEESISDLQADRYERHLFRGDAGARRFAAMMTRLESRAEELRGMPVSEARDEVVLSQDTFRERWESLETDHDRGDMLRRMRMRAYVRKEDDGTVRLRLRRGDSGRPDLAEYDGDDRT